MSESKLPGFVVVGAPKCGTTSLYHYLKQHPGIYLPARKELHYFSSRALLQNDRGPGDSVALARVCNTLESYREFYREAEDRQISGDVSPSYLYFDESRHRILEELGRVRIVAILRDPCEKAFSQYMHLIRDQRETLPFRRALDAEADRVRQGWSDLWRYAESSLYAKKLARYFELFGEDRVKVLFFDELVAAPDRTMRELFEFLGVDADFDCDTSRTYNRSGRARSPRAARLLTRPNVLKATARRLVPRRYRLWISQTLIGWNTGRKPELDRESRDYLQAYFSDDASELSRLLGRSLPWAD